MTPRQIKYFFIAAPLCLLLFGLIPAESGSILWLPALPFTALGNMLRRLSLSGNAGNAAAVAIYVLLPFLPLLMKIKRKWFPEDWLLPLAGLTALYVLYHAINPGLRAPALSSESEIGALIEAGAFWSILAAWCAVRIIRVCEGSNAGRLYRLLQIFAILCAGLCILTGFGTGFSALRQSIAQVNAQNTMPGLNLAPTFCMLTLSFLIHALEYGLDALIFLYAACLLHAENAAAQKTQCNIENSHWDVSDDSIYNMNAQRQSQGNCEQIADHRLPQGDGQKRKHIPCDKVKACKGCCVQPLQKRAFPVSGDQ